jgi:FixJ family two-component response regulator
MPRPDVALKKSGAAAHLWKHVDEQALLHAIRRAIGQDANPEGEERPSRAPCRVSNFDQSPGEHF